MSLHRFLTVVWLATAWSGCQAPPPVKRPFPPSGALLERTITVDGDPSDWQGMAPNVVEGEDNLWFGQGMTREKWLGNNDLSYRWSGAWSGNKLYFLFEVMDDELVETGQAASYLCDCVELYLDWANQGGQRVVVMDGRPNWFDRCDPRELRGYELHFLPTSPPRAFLDHTFKYAIDHPQTDQFSREWAGEIATKKVPGGYLLEVGFSVPNLQLKPGLTLGVEAGVCDDDGLGRKSILIWTGTKKDFWITMDDYGKATLISNRR